jgi:hypothetical protein
MTEIGIIAVMLVATLGAYVTWWKLGSVSELQRMGHSKDAHAPSFGFERGADGKFRLRSPLSLHLRICLSLLCGLLQATILALYLKYIVGL